MKVPGSMMGRVEDCAKEGEMMKRLRIGILIPAAVILLTAIATPAFASDVCPVIGGPNNPSIMTTPAEVPDKSGNPAHGADPSSPQPGDAFWN
jgi:hypothetical protein